MDIICTNEFFGNQEEIMQDEGRFFRNKTGDTIIFHQMKHLQEIADQI